MCERARVGRSAVSKSPQLRVLEGRATTRLADQLRRAIKAPRRDLSPGVVFSNPSRRQIDLSLLMRLGDGVREGRTARRKLARMLTERLEDTVLNAGFERESLVLTSVPERYGATHEHAFVSFCRALSADLGIEFINDQFIETAPRPDLADVPVTRREKLLRSCWRYRGSLKGRVAILLDDIVDSGASLNVASRRLRQAGARVAPLALISMHDAREQLQRVTREQLGDQRRDLLALPEIPDSLRRDIESWVREG